MSSVTLSRISFLKIFLVQFNGFNEVDTGIYLPDKDIVAEVNITFKGR